MQRSNYSKGHTSTLWPIGRLSTNTDASVSYWSAITIKTSHDDKKRPYLLKRHEPLALLSGTFSTTQLRWSIVEKRTFAFMVAVKLEHYLPAVSEGVGLFTDHKNFIFIIDTPSTIPNLGIAAVRKVLWWPIHLSAYNYVCIYIVGAEKDCADFLGRCTTQSTILRLA